MTDYKPLKSPLEIDLDKDGLLEASAGTGKTWTLTRLAVRLLLEKKLDIEEVLIVTYTEKAAGEMKDKLRALMEETIHTGVFLDEKLKTEALAHLRRQALNYDRAPVQTIHGFCLGTLRRYAFENGFHFQMEQADDREIATEALRTLLETTFPKEFGKTLENFLQLSNFAPPCKFASGWEKQVINLALKAHPGHSEIRPQPQENLPSQLTGMLDKFTTMVPALHLHAQKFLSKANKALTAAPALLESGATALQLYQSIQDAKADLRLLVKCQDDQEAAAVLAKLLPILKEINDLGMAFLSDVVIRTRTETRLLKEKRQQITFDDMLTRVEEGLARPDNLLLNSLRRQYKAALVDEFQDTDPIQWTIFRKVFLESDNHRLYIIGDPKQAIYAFRGADIHTYYEAAAELRRNTPAKAGCYRLPINRRSAATAITACNTFFKNHFAIPQEKEAWQQWTEFYPAQAPPKFRNRLTKGDPASSGLFGVDLGDGRVEPLRIDAARWIAADCRRLLGSGLRLMVDNGDERPLDPADLCVLTRKKATSILVEKELMLLGLPCTIYKKEGIYGTTEALHLSLLLRHLAAPEESDLTRLTLLSRFFCSDPGILPSIPGPEQEAGRFLNKLTRLAHLRKWGELFRVLLQESGILLREYPLPDGPRRITNLEQICQGLETVALSGGFDIHRLAEHLARLINEEGETEEDETLHRIESEEPRIHIMTIHASKGLEYPFTYVTMPLEESSQNKDPWHTWPENGKRIYDLTKSGEARHKHEVSEEDKRLLYVALTRGVFRTVLFYSKDDKRYQSLTPAPQPDLHDRTLFSLAATEKPLSLPRPLFDLPEQFLKDGYRKRRISLASFSSLVGHIEDGPAFGEDTRKDADEPEIHLPELEGTILLPRGPRTGNLLHSLLENTNFSEAASGFEQFFKANRQRIATALFKSHIKPAAGWLEQNPTTEDDTPKGTGELAREVGRLLYAALTVPLLDHDKKPFHLHELAPNDKKHELEFHFLMDEKEAAKIKDGELWFAKGFITGFIDLVFRHGGRYYILDWKSNWLPAYGQTELEQGMKTHNYHLQASIYAEALSRWLTTHNLPAGQEHFGGVYYLFLRGLSPEGAGVYAIPNPAPFPPSKENKHA